MDFGSQQAPLGLVWSESIPNRGWRLTMTTAGRIGVTNYQRYVCVCPYDRYTQQYLFGGCSWFFKMYIVLLLV